jgi:hypothetical protein
MSKIQREELLQKFIPNKYDYDRMDGYNCDGIEEGESYDDFLEWNIKCIIECSEDDYNFIAKLCSKISSKQIGQMDMESCVVWESDGIFFNKQKNIVIYHPR